MQAFTPAILVDIQHELETLFSAHEAVGLNGKMCLYTHPDQKIWRAEKAGTQLWFGRNEIPAALEKIKELYNSGSLPNSPPLLNPIIHTLQEDGTMQPQGSGVVWCTVFCLGQNKLQPESRERLLSLGCFTSEFHRGENEKAGLKIVGFTSEAVQAENEGWNAKGNRDLYNLAQIDSPDYGAYYLLSGLQYLCTHGLFGHPSFMSMLPESLATTRDHENIRAYEIKPQEIYDASTSWDAYDHHHSLYRKFGTNTADIENNLKFYKLCARDIQLFDSTGVRHMDAKTEVGFDFLVEGWIPRGAVTVIGATGGTGKSSLAHNLAVKASIDYKFEDQIPTWLGSKLVLKNTSGIVVYLSGEDGPQIVHARAKVFDPKGRSHRLMVQRTDFGDGVTLAGFLKRLSALPEVPLVVIDPARKYLTGDEEDATVVSHFFEAIEEFAINKNSAVVVVHHLAKNAKPTHVSEIYDLLRGSQVFIDRPRVVIGLYRDGNYTVAGLAKNNIPPQLGMIQGERVFVRDEKRLELALLPGDKGIRHFGLSEEEVAAMLDETKKANIRKAAMGS